MSNPVETTSRTMLLARVDDVSKDSFTLKPGTYYVGDPSYAADNTPGAWMRINHASNAFAEPYCAIDEGEIIFGGTASGDGAYDGSNGVTYEVDRGVIGIMTIETAKALGAIEDELRDSGSIEVFDEPFVVTLSKGGHFMFGHIEIATDGGNEEVVAPDDDSWDEYPDEELDSEKDPDPRVDND